MSEIALKCVIINLTFALTHFVVLILSVSTEKEMIAIDPSVNSTLYAKTDMSLFDTTRFPFISLLINFEVELY